MVILPANCSCSGIFDLPGTFNGLATDKVHGCHGGSNSPDTAETPILASLIFPSSAKIFDIFKALHQLLGMLFARLDGQLCQHAQSLASLVELFG